MHQSPYISSKVGTHPAGITSEYANPDHWPLRPLWNAILNKQRKYRFNRGTAKLYESTMNNLLLLRGNSAYNSYLLLYSQHYAL